MKPGKEEKESGPRSLYIIIDPDYKNYFNWNGFLATKDSYDLVFDDGKAIYQIELKALEKGCIEKMSKEGKLKYVNPKGMKSEYQKVLVIGHGGTTEEFLGKDIDAVDVGNRIVNLLEKLRLKPGCEIRIQICNSGGHKFSDGKTFQEMCTPVGQTSFAPGSYSLIFQNGKFVDLPNDRVLFEQLKIVLTGELAVAKKAIRTFAVSKYLKEENLDKKYEIPKILMGTFKDRYTSECDKSEKKVVDKKSKKNSHVAKLEKRRLQEMFFKGRSFG